MTTPLHSRADWGARPRKADPPEIVSEGVTAHYGGPSPWGSSVDRSTQARFMATASHDRCPSIVRAWQDYHMDFQGWNDIAYNSCVCPHGHRYEGRGVGQRSGANGTNDGNDRSEAVCYIAGQGDPLTDPAKEAYLDEAVRMEAPAMRWVHSDWKSTACPGDPIRAWKAAGWPSPTPAPTPPPPPPEEDDNPMKNAMLVRFIVNGAPAPEIILADGALTSAFWVRSSAARKGYEHLIKGAGGTGALCTLDPSDDDVNMAQIARAVLNLPMVGDMPPSYAASWKGPHIPGA